MLPLKVTHEHDEIQKLMPVRLVDLRDYGLAASAPFEDGHQVLVFRLNDAGALVPAA